MPKFNIIGAGQVGSALGYLLSNHTPLALAGVLSRSISRAGQLCSWIGQGQAVLDYSSLPSANLYLVTVPDEQIRSCAEKLAATALLRPGDIVIHCSGMLSSEELSPVKDKGAHIASLHPIKSFIDPQLSISSFPGTFCGLEGDLEACTALQPWISAMGGKVFTIDPQQKLIYHSALVFASNYLVALSEVAISCLEQAKIDRQLSYEILSPLMRLTAEQVFTKGTTVALSGPIARGDSQVVREELKELTAWNPAIGEAYRLLGQFALELANQKDTANPEKMKEITQILQKD